MSCCLASRRFRPVGLCDLLLHGTAAVLISIFVYTLTSEASRAESSVPPQATVFLMSGLAGDVETENAYREQMQTLLDILAGNNPRRIIALCDEPESVSLTKNAENRILKANRTNFLDAAASVAAETNPVVIIAWGHGGRQGNTPVFHVRGPRLTPADFQAAAGKMKAMEAQWFLFFRGSGAFASQLAGPGREIISSQSVTVFNSDPVGMPLLIKLLKNNSRISFEKLAEGLGRATVGWYEERHLARTEEPTLWSGNDKPRLLAENALDKEENETKPEKPESLQGEPDSRHAPTAVWKEIQKIAPSRYPEADAVNLRRRLSFTFGTSPAVATERDEFIQVLSLEGKHFGDFDVSYAPPFEEIYFLDCEVLQPDGTVARLDPDAVREQREESVADYQFGRRKYFSLPGVVPGAVLHLRYRTEWQKFPLPHASMEISLGQQIPVLETVVQVTVPRDEPFHFLTEQTAGLDPAIKQSGYATTYIWKFQNLPAYEYEPLTAPRLQPRLLVSTFPDWRQFADWYSRVSKLANEVTPEIAAKAVALISEAKTDREKVVAIYNYVTALRYVAVPLGVNSFRPHAAATVLRNQFGDCKDKANLFNALLHSLKIEAHLVLLPRFSQAYDNLPGLAFNHAISQVPLDGKPVWVDTTDDVCRFGLLPPGDAGRKVLVIDGKSDSLAELPLPLADENKLKLAGHVDCVHPADPLPIRLRFIAHGYPDYEMRAALRQNKGHSAAAPLLGEKYKPINGACAVDAQSSTEISGLDEDFSEKMEGTWLAGASLIAGKWVVHAPFWIPKEWEVALHQRENPIFLNQGYPLSLEEEFEFCLPPKVELGPLVSLRQRLQGPLRWTSEWARVGNDKLSARFHAELAHGQLSLSESAEFQKQLRELLMAFAGGNTFSVPQ